MTSTQQASKWFAAGVAEHRQFLAKFQSAKEHALNAGFFFLSARQSIPDGAWGDFVALREQQIPDRTVRQYVAFASEALAWVKREQPKLAGDRAQAAAMEMVMQSPRGLVALCRELKLMRKFGEYDEVRYALAKRHGKVPKDGQPLQLMFSFEAAQREISALIQAPNVADLADSSLERLESDLSAALARVREIKAAREAKTINVATEAIATLTQ